MASTYPTSLDSFTNPIAANPLTAPSHAQQHADINDAVEALEAKVAIGNTVLGTYTSYTPTFNGLTLGNGTMVAKYCTVNQLVHYYGKITFGSTTSFTTSNVSIIMPYISDSPTAYTAIAGGVSYFYDLSTGSFYPGVTALNNSGQAFFGGVMLANGTYSQWTPWGSTTPFTWATGDYYSWNMTYKRP